MNKLIVSIISLVLVALIIISGWGTNGLNNKDCMFGKNKKYEGIFDRGCLDVWHLSHFVLWFIVGCTLPGYFIPVLIVSILWETGEHISFKYILKICDGFYCGRIEDIILNVLGYAIGSRLII